MTNGPWRISIYAISRNISAKTTSFGTDPEIHDSEFVVLLVFRLAANHYYAP